LLGDAVMSVRIPLFPDSNFRAPVLLYMCLEQAADSVASDITSCFLARCGH
jgi:hypothetical protein